MSIAGSFRLSWAFMDRFGSFWAILGQNKPCQAALCCFGSIRTCWTDLERFGSLQSISGHFELTGAVSAVLNLFKPFLIVFGQFWSDLRYFMLFRIVLDCFGSFQTVLDFFGGFYFGLFWVNTSRFWQFQTASDHIENSPNWLVTT
jgi:hypothetical protein